MGYTYGPSDTLSDLKDLQYDYDERVAIMIFDGGVEESLAELIAANNRGFVSKEAFDYFIAKRREEIEYDQFRSLFV